MTDNLSVVFDGGCFNLVSFVTMYTLKKSLGQHFLIDQEIIRLIIQALKEHSFSNLLEVGPGGGALTSHLVQLPNIDFKAVELDAEKVTFLTKAYPVLKDKLIHQSFLDMDVPFDDSFIVIGNFPYNISTQILFKILDWKDQVPVLIGMFQKEVAQRAASVPGSKSFGVLSALLQPFYDIEYLFDVPAQSFNPPPKVESGVIRLTRSTTELTYRSYKHYRLLVKTAFNQRRKTLRNSVKSIFPKEVLQEEIFLRRPETMSIQEFAALTFKMN